ncbi:MAG: hypothetical protein CSA09_03840 [Candidatus Contendobacter odensis]|uniref:Molybdopterin synthase catalytic subunit n=1 Tax=Candidatus Contendibacter odensensis TaxID=1400860 RepID=A0A2G6PES0_9GAMM|nr:MAG: hypothetical protein CSA09_03840 [Candidatus Contendobacter odensis]
MVKTTCDRWQVLDALVIHRVGVLQPNNPIVIGMVGTSGRGVCSMLQPYGVA